MSSTDQDYLSLSIRQAQSCYLYLLGPQAALQSSGEKVLRIKKTTFFVYLVHGYTCHEREKGIAYRGIARDSIQHTV